MKFASRFSQVAPTLVAVSAFALSCGDGGSSLVLDTGAPMGPVIDAAAESIHDAATVTTLDAGGELPSGQEVGVSARDTADSRSDETNTDVPDDANCATLSSRWSQFVLANSACTVDTDCVRVGGTGTCNCAPAIGKSSGDAIATSAVAAANAFLKEFSSAVCAAYFGPYNGTCDAAPGIHLRCEARQCKVDEASCLSVGPIDAAMDIRDAPSVTYDSAIDLSPNDGSLASQEAGRR